jgi:predicted ATP-dependent serine protease
MRRRIDNPFEGQWQCSTCGRTFGRHFKRCAYCPTGDVIEDSWRDLVRKLLAAEGKAPWATEGRSRVSMAASAEVIEQRRWRKPRFSKGVER